MKALSKMTRVEIVKELQNEHNVTDRQCALMNTPELRTWLRAKRTPRK